MKITQPVSFGSAAVVLGATAADGSAEQALRVDATIAAFDATNPATIAFAASPAVGSAATAARRDHGHGMAAAFDTTNPTTIAYAASPAVGSAAVTARRDHGHGMAARAGVVQRVDTITGAVATGSTTIPFDDTIPQSNEGVEFMTRTITPVASANRLIITITAQGGPSHDAILAVALFKDSDAGALAVGASQGLGGKFMDVSLEYVMDAGTTSEIDFKVNIGMNAAGTYTFNGNGGARSYGGVLASSITILEVT